MDPDWTCAFSAPSAQRQVISSAAGFPLQSHYLSEGALQETAGSPDTSQSRMDSNLMTPAALQQQSRKQQRLMLGAGDLGLLTGPGRLQRSTL